MQDRPSSTLIALAILLPACASDAASDALAQTQQALSAVPVITSSVDTPALHGYDDAPRAVDSDDPAIWIHPKNPDKSLILGALKDAGLQVYDLTGKVVQTIVPPHRPALSAADPTAPGPQPDPGTSACPESASGETFGRYNNVDVQYDVEVSQGQGRSRRVDLAVVTDRGCDRVRFYAIDPERSGGPLVDVTAPNAPRVFPKRFEQPSQYQPTGAAAGVIDNPLDDQSTVYGLALYRPAKSKSLTAFVTQRSRSVVAELQIVADANGKFTYTKQREYRFPTSFELPKRKNAPAQRWTPCREDPTDDPQLEGLVVDQETGTLYAAHEPIGVWQLSPSKASGSVVNVSFDQLIEKSRSFGQAYWAIPDEDEFSCETPDGTPPSDAIVVPGDPSLAGAHLQADVEGLAIYYGRNKEDGYLIVSSQGDDTFHVYARKNPRKHLGTFQIDGTGETDGHDLVNVKLGTSFPQGLFVAQNGKAPEPASTAPINGYDYDNSTQFRLLDWADIAAELDLSIDTESYNPRKPR